MLLLIQNIHIRCSIAQNKERLLDELMELLKLEGQKECSNQCTTEPPAKWQKKTSAMHFLLGTETEDTAILISMDEVEQFIEDPFLDHDSKSYRVVEK